jgi:hypothetical protein
MNNALKYIVAVLAAAGFAIWRGWTSDIYQAIATVPLGLLAFAIMIAVARRNAAVAEEDDEAGSDDPEDQPSPLGNVFVGILLAVVLVGSMWLEKTVVDRTQLATQFYDIDRPALTQDIQLLETTGGWKKVEDLAVDRLTRHLSGDWQRELEATVLDAIIHQAREAETPQKKLDLYNRAIAWATAHGLSPDLASAELALAKPTATPTPIPTSTPLPTATLRPTRTPTATPEGAQILPNGTTAQLLRDQPVPGANLYYVRVTDPDGKPFIGLTDRDVTAGGSRVTVTDLSVHPEPKSVVLAIDASGSMQTSGAMAATIQGAKAFVSTLSSGDEVLVLVFQGTTVTSSGWLSDRTKAVAAIDAIQAHGDTPLYDAVFSALKELKSRNGRQILVVLSDGNDTSSQLIQETDVTSLLTVVQPEIYPIRVGDANRSFFDLLAHQTGGTVQALTKPGDIVAAFSAVSDLIGQQYAILVEGNTPPSRITIGSGPTKIVFTIK